MRSKFIENNIILQMILLWNGVIIVQLKGFWQVLIKNEEKTASYL